MSIVRIKFPAVDKIYTYQTSKKIDYKINERVLIDCNQIIELASVVNIIDDNESIKKTKIQDYEVGVGTIIRKVNENDEKKIAKLKILALEYLPLCQDKISKHKLEGMKLLNADLSYDGKKLTIYFGAEGRIDFRELVSDLIRSFKKLIRLQQVGARDEARLFGGFGPCGREICCKKHLKDIESITLDMAKEQNLLTSAAKISGICGKLMCCLAYEKGLYCEARKKMPSIGKIIKVGKSEGEVIEQNVITSTVKIKTKDGKIEKIAVDKLT